MRILIFGLGLILATMAWAGKDQTPSPDSSLKSCQKMLVDNLDILPTQEINASIEKQFQTVIRDLVATENHQLTGSIAATLEIEIDGKMETVDNLRLLHLVSEYRRITGEDLRDKVRASMKQGLSLTEMAWRLEFVEVSIREAYLRLIREATAAALRKDWAYKDIKGNVLDKTHLQHLLTLQFDQLFEIVSLIGDTGSGKTLLTSRFAEKLKDVGHPYLRVAAPWNTTNIKGIDALLGPTKHASILRWIYDEEMRAELLAILPENTVVIFDLRPIEFVTFEGWSADDGAPFHLKPNPADSVNGELQTQLLNFARDLKTRKHGQLVVTVYSPLMYALSDKTKPSLMDHGLLSTKIHMKRELDKP